MLTFEQIFASWPSDPWLAAMLFASAAVYVRGWRWLRRRDPLRWHPTKLAAFLGGLAAIYLALASPLETFASLVLPAHMAQHLLLMMVAPPLLWLGAPMMPLLRGLPREIRAVWISPLLRSKLLRTLAATLTHPVVALLLFAGTTWLWHWPEMYELALASPSWHYLQHACFLAAGLLFWYPIVRPYPAKPRWPKWFLAPYLILADVQNTILSALLTFSDRVLYPHYETMPRIGGGSVIDDQAAAGVMMWVPGSLAFLLPLAWIGLGLMQRGNLAWRVPNQERSDPDTRKTNPNPTLLSRGSSPVPIFFSAWRYLLRSLWLRRVVQTISLLVAAAIIVDGWWGPSIGPMNLAGVVPWIHWRGLVVFGSLAVGNIFCYGCPFMLPRTVARKWLRAGRHWPRWLRSKWLAVALVAVFLWTYEAFSLWNSPWLTAWIAVAYFAGALVIDGIFRDAPFCKYVCPIGQFHFVQSIVSPLEVRVRQPAACTSCTTHDCITGRGSLSGCELHLFQPRKSGNLDCTFCLDCVRACPHDNVGVLAVVPTASLWQETADAGSLQSGGSLLDLQRLRLDYAVLATLLVFGAFGNAAGMIAPVVELQDRIAASFNLSSTFWVTTAFYGIALFLHPLICITICALTSRRLASTTLPVRTIACRFAWCLVPLGFAMWTAHYGFHFFTSFDSIVPTSQRFAAELGFGSLGSPNWSCSCCKPAPDWLLKFEIVMLDLGLLASLYSMWRVALSLLGSRSAAMKAAVPWALLATALFAAGVWILLQPMEMRGMLPA